MAGMLKGSKLIIVFAFRIMGYVYVVGWDRIFRNFSFLYRIWAHQHRIGYGKCNIFNHVQNAFDSIFVIHLRGWMLVL